MESRFHYRQIFSHLSTGRWRDPPSNPFAITIIYHPSASPPYSCCSSNDWVPAQSCRCVYYLADSSTRSWNGNRHCSAICCGYASYHPKTKQVVLSVYTHVPPSIKVYKLEEELRQTTHLDHISWHAYIDHHPPLIQHMIAILLTLAQTDGNFTISFQNETIILV